MAATSGAANTCKSSLVSTPPLVLSFVLSLSCVRMVHISEFQEKSTLNPRRHHVSITILFFVHLDSPVRRAEKFRKNIRSPYVYCVKITVPGQQAQGGDVGARTQYS